MIILKHLTDGAGTVLKLHDQGWDQLEGNLHHNIPKEYRSYQVLLVNEGTAANPRNFLYHCFDENK